MRVVALACFIVLVGLALSGCLVGGPLYGETEVNEVTETQRTDERVDTLRAVEATRRPGGEPGQSPVFDVVVLEREEMSFTEREGTGQEVVYHYGQFSLLNEILAENTYGYAYLPILAMIDMFRAPYYLFRGELEVAGRCAASLLFMMPGIQLSFYSNEGYDPLTPGNGAIRYPPDEIDETSATPRTENVDRPAGECSVTVLVSGSVVARLLTSDAGHTEFVPAEHPDLLARLEEGHTLEVVFEPESAGGGSTSACIVLEEAEVRTLIRERDGR